jgi:hypothetical protein
MFMRVLCDFRYTLYYSGLFRRAACYTEAPGIDTRAVVYAIKPGTLPGHGRGCVHASNKIPLLLLPSRGVIQQPAMGLSYRTQAECEVGRADLAAKEDWRSTGKVWAIVCVKK